MHKILFFYHIIRRSDKLAFYRCSKALRSWIFFETIYLCVMWLMQMSLLIHQLGNEFLGLIFKLHLKQTENAVFLWKLPINERMSTSGLPITTLPEIRAISYVSIRRIIINEGFEWPVYNGCGGMMKFVQVEGKMVVCCENVAPHVTESFFEGAECLTQKRMLSNDKILLKTIHIGVLWDQP